MIHRLDKRLVEPEAEIAKLRENSSTSSKPPSRDGVKPPKPKPMGSRKRRKIGGQPGRPRHERQSLAEPDVDQFWVYGLDRCPDRGGRAKQAKARPRVVHQVEVVKSPTRAGSVPECCG